ncbi:MAG: GspH/FimT family pseudopilin [Nitrospirota bacterium]
MSARRNAEQGITLVELLFAVAVVGILMAIAVPQVRTWSVQHQRSAAATEIFALINQARSIAVNTSTQATITVTTTATPPGGSIVAQIGAPTNWTKQITLGTGPYSGVGLVAAAPAGTYTITPRGTVQPGSFTLTLQDLNSKQATVATGILGDVTVSIL